MKSKQTIREKEGSARDEQPLAVTEIQIHGVMVEINGVGVLLLGDSGVGKSEAALELISRNHKLIADDAVVIKRDVEGELIAAQCPVTADLLEIRGLGIINVRKVFGNDALLKKSRVSLCVRLIQGEAVRDDLRSGIALRSETIAGREVPAFHIAVKPGRNIPVLLEAAVRILVANQQDKPDIL